MLETSIHCLDNHKTSIVLQKDRIKFLMEKTQKLKYQISYEEQHSGSEEVLEELKVEKKESLHSMIVALVTSVTEYIQFQHYSKNIQTEDEIDQLTLEKIRNDGENAISDIVKNIEYLLDIIIDQHIKRAEQLESRISCQERPRSDTEKKELSIEKKECFENINIALVTIEALCLELQDNSNDIDFGSILKEIGLQKINNNASINIIVASIKIIETTIENIKSSVDNILKEDIKEGKNQQLCA